MKYLKKYNESFDEGRKLKTIATNECYWSWNYDAQVRVAKLLLDELEGKLYLEIKLTHTKSGIGAGQTTRQLAYEPVGTIKKPELGLIRTLLSKHKYSEDNRFKRNWIDSDNNEDSLSNIIKNSRYHKLQRLKIVGNEIQKEKEIKNIEKGIKIIKYKRGYVAYGEGTIKYKDELRPISKYNRFLTHPETGDKFTGWIISNNNLDKVKAILGVSKIQESFSLLSDKDIYATKVEFSKNPEKVKKLFPDIIDHFKEIIIDDSDLSYMKSESPDKLQDDFESACQAYKGSHLTQIENDFLNYISKGKKDYKELDNEAKEIYNTLEHRMDIMWEILLMEWNEKDIF